MEIQPWKRWQKKAFFLLVLTLVPMILVGVFLAMQAEFQNVAWVRQSEQRTLIKRDLLSNLLVVHADAESAAWGFITTQEPHFLRTFDGALTKRDEILLALEDKSGPAVRIRLDALRELSDVKFDNSTQRIAAARTGHSDHAHARMMHEYSISLMDKIRNEINVMKEYEAETMARLTERSEDSRVLIEHSVIALLAWLTILLAVVALVVTRSFRVRSEVLKRTERLNEWHKAMFYGAEDGMLLLDGEGRILRMNPSISRMFGHGERELLGRHSQILIHDTYSRKQSREWLADVDMAGAHGAGRRQEFTGKRADGTTFDTEVAISRVEDESGRRYVTAIRDISERKRAEQMKTEFVSTVSHELRTPLTSIGGSLGLLGAGVAGKLDEKALRLVDIARSNCERLIRLINDILDIEKIEFGKMGFDLRRMQMAPMINRTVAAIRGFADQQGVTVKTVLAPWPQRVAGDPDKLEQLLTNLLSNAVKHAPEGSEVEVVSLSQQGKVRVEVRDRGAGVPESFRGRIFDKFAMADATDSRAKGGTGLGLAIAREIARRHDGEVGFEDRPGGGTTFYFEIPSLRNTIPDSGEAIDPGLPRVLFIDDDHDTLSIVTSTFAGKANIVPVNTLGEARDALASDDFDGAIIDVSLDYENGFDIVPELRARDAFMPIVVFTAIDEAHPTAEVDRVLIKSRSSVADLADATLKLLERRKQAA